MQLIYAIDTDRDGCISYEEFLTVVEQGQGVLAEMKMLEAQRIRVANAADNGGAAYIKGQEVAALSVSSCLPLSSCTLRCVRRAVSYW